MTKLGRVGFPGSAPPQPQARWRCRGGSSWCGEPKVFQGGACARGGGAKRVDPSPDTVGGRQGGTGGCTRAVEKVV